MLDTAEARRSRRLGVREPGPCEARRQDGSSTPEAVAVDAVASVLAVVLVADGRVGELLAASDDLAAATHWMHAGFARLATLQDAGILRPRLLQLRDLIERRQLLEPLTPAERHVLELLPTELSLKEIGARLHVSHETARTHARDIYRKLEVHSRSEAVARARELGLVAAS